MTGARKTLLVVFAFIAIILGSFIWFVATWDASKEEPVTSLPQTEMTA